MKKDKLDYILKFKSEPDKLTKISRRDLLAAGAIPFLAQSTGFNLISQLLSPSLAQAQAATHWIPYINVNLSGGASLCATVVPLDKNRELLNNYQYLGLGTLPKTTTYMGSTLDSRSQFLAGLKSIVSDAAEQKSKIVSLCTNIDADTAGVEGLKAQHNVTPQLEKIGKNGQYFSSLDYDLVRSSIKNFHINSPRSIIAVNTLSDLVNSLVFTSKLADPQISDRQISALVKSVSDLSKVQLQNNPSLSGKSIRVNETLASVNKIASGDTDIVEKLDPTGSANFVKDQAIASVVLSSLNNYSTASSIYLGGYDYHVPNRAVSDAADYVAGEQVGRVIELAHRLKKPVFIFVSTDGANQSAVSEYNDSPWTGDTRSSIQLVFAYHPQGVKKAKNDLQIGHFNPSTESLRVPLAELNTVVGDRSDYVSAAVMANYLSLHKNGLSLFGTAAPSTLTPSKVDEAVKITL
jgi:hypothetical protein